MFLNIARYFLIILLNSGLPVFCMDTLSSQEPALQSICDRYDQISRLHIKVPKNLCELYEFHQTHILDDYKGYYASKEHNNEEISSFCYLHLLCTNDFQGCDEGYEEVYDEELFATIKHANDQSLNGGFNITGHLNPGHSGAEIYILQGKTPKFAKIIKSQSSEGLKLGFLELSNSLIALSLNPDPSNIKMARIFSAGYSFFPGSGEYIFCMLLEKASGESIKDLLHDKFIDNPGSFDGVLNNTAQYLAYFHVNFYKGFRANKIHTEVKNAEIKDRENFCYRRVNVLRQDMAFNTNEKVFFNYKNALKDIEGIFDQRIQASALILLEQHLEDYLNKYKTWDIAMEDRVITHGDMHVGNLCYKEEGEGSPLHRLTMIDFSSMKRTYGAIGDPAQDVGKFLGSIWKEVALCLAQKYGDKKSMETWYSILCRWQEVFLGAYIEAYALAKKEPMTHACVPVRNREPGELLNLDIMANFKERVYFYKLCLYTQFFNDPRPEVEPTGFLKARRLLFYFFLQESGLLDQVINANSSNADTGLKINGRPSSLQKEPSNQIFIRNDSIHLSPLADVSNLIFVQICREPGNGHTEKKVIYKSPYSSLIQSPIPAQSGWCPTWNSFCSDLIQNPFLPNLGSSASPNQ